MTTRTDIAAPKVNYPHGKLTEPIIRNANYKLQKKYGKPKGSARKSRKGKQRAGAARSTASHPRSGTEETGEFGVAYQDDVSFRDPAQAQVFLRSGDN